MKLAVLYAGQGAQHPGMGRDFYEASPAFRAAFDSAELDFDLHRVCFEDPDGVLNQTEYTQPCMVAFACGVTAVLAEKGMQPAYAAGLSLGEYSALEAAGVFTAKQAIELTAYRGKAMADAAKGIDCGMTAVLSLDRNTLAQCCEQAAELGCVQICNYNCPGQLVIGGFTSMKALSTASDPDAASLPFDARRGGFVMGEGSGVLVLEELEHAKARGAHIYAEVVGYGANCDAYHFTAPAPGGVGAIDCMNLTLNDAGIAPEQVDHINAHGTGTHMNDACETAAIHAVFGEHAKRLTVVSTKSMTGHLLGGAGGIEAVFTALALRDQFAPPTIHYEQPDPECDLDYVPNTGRAQAMTYALSNSLGFGGHNACIALRRWEG